MLAAALRQLLLPSTHLSLTAALQQQALPSTMLLLPQAAAAAAATAHSPAWPSQQQLLQQHTCPFTTSSSSLAAKRAQNPKPPPSRHERNIANHRFQQQRAIWKLQLKELRKQWREEHRQRLQAHKASSSLAQQQVNDFLFCILGPVGTSELNVK